MLLISFKNVWEKLKIKAEIDSIITGFGLTFDSNIFEFVNNSYIFLFRQKKFEIKVGKKISLIKSHLYEACIWHKPLINASEKTKIFLFLLNTNLKLNCFVIYVDSIRFSKIGRELLIEDLLLNNHF